MPSKKDFILETFYEKKTENGTIWLVRVKKRTD